MKKTQTKSTSMLAPVLALVALLLAIVLVLQLFLLKRAKLVEVPSKPIQTNAELQETLSEVEKTDVDAVLNPELSALATEQQSIR